MLDYKSHVHDCLHDKIVPQKRTYALAYSLQFSRYYM